MTAASARPACARVAEVYRFGPRGPELVLITPCALAISRLTRGSVLYAHRWTKAPAHRSLHAGEPPTPLR